MSSHFWIKLYCYGNQGNQVQGMVMRFANHPITQSYHYICSDVFWLGE